jgi:hypothetical protein
MWTNRQFWLDSSWRAFRTFSQTLAALLAANFTGLLSTTGVSVGDGGIPHTPWLAMIYTAGIAALISLLQSIDRERAANHYPSSTDYDPPTTPLSNAYYDDSDEPLGHGHGESLR